MTTNLLADDGTDELASDVPPDLGGEQSLVREGLEGFLLVNRALGDNVRDFVVDEEEDEGDGFDGLGEEEAEAGEGGLFGLVRDGGLVGAATDGKEGEEVLLSE